MSLRLSILAKTFDVLLGDADLLAGVDVDEDGSSVPLQFSVCPVMRVARQIDRRWRVCSCFKKASNACFAEGASKS
jgi:hypothetical protein